MKRMKIACFLLALLCTAVILSGCGAKEQIEAAPAAEQSPGPTQPGHPDGRSGQRGTEEQMEAMKDFLAAHQAEMEEIVAVMMGYSSRETENEYTDFWYSVTWQELHQSHTLIKNGRGLESKEEGVFTEHPIITKIRALGEDPVFDFAATDLSHRIVDNDICCFSRMVRDVADDGNGVWYTDVYLFYCEEEPVEQEHFYIYPVIPHWYLYIEHLE
ncbi:MAG: hypothetical protein IK095_04475 [Oscillospiraceae bacterium]|nr:hypothetical protein [Oscillospiraceae bacterium]